MSVVIHTKLSPGVGTGVENGSVGQDEIATNEVVCDGKTYTVLAVFDGHGGTEDEYFNLSNGAALAGVRVINSLSDPNNKYGLTGVPDVDKILEAIHEEFKSSKDDNSGSTATIVVVNEQNNVEGCIVEGCILGDSAIRIIRDDRTIETYTGASPNDKATRDQVIARGGEVAYFPEYQAWRVKCPSGGSIAVADCVGNNDTPGMGKKGVPVKFQLDPEETLLIGSDGLDKIDSRRLDMNFRIAKKTCKGDIQQTAYMLACSVYAEASRLSADDVAVILYQPKPNNIASESAAGP